MKKALTIAVAGVALAASLTLVVAGSRAVEPERVAATEAVPSGYILTTLLRMGLSPISQPLRRGPYYVLHAYDPRGVEVRVVADAVLGDILDVTPVPPLVLPYERGPRIIHVPQPGEGDQSAIPDARDEPAMSDDDGGEQIAPAPPPRQRAVPKPRQHSDAAPAPRRKLYGKATPPLPPAQRRAVLSAPPPPAETSLTPIYPTPRFKADADSSEKFSPPKEPEVTASTPPVGYTPPATPPPSDAPAPPPPADTTPPPASAPIDDSH